MANNIIPQSISSQNKLLLIEMNDHFPLIPIYQQEQSQLPEYLSGLVAVHCDCDY